MFGVSLFLTCWAFMRLLTNKTVCVFQGTAQVANSWERTEITNLRLCLTWKMSGFWLSNQNIVTRLISSEVPEWQKSKCVNSFPEGHHLTFHRLGWVCVCRSGFSVTVFISRPHLPQPLRVSFGRFYALVPLNEHTHSLTHTVGCLFSSKWEPWDLGESRQMWSKSIKCQDI